MRQGPGTTFGDDGFAGGMDAVVVGMLVFVVSMLLVVNAWAVVDAKLAVEAAAREATRSFVDSTDADRAWANAGDASRAAIAGHGRDPSRATTVPRGTARLERCAVVAIEVRYPVVLFPLSVLGRGGKTFDVVGSHAERVDAHRSGLAGAAPC